MPPGDPHTPESPPAGPLTPEPAPPPAPPTPEAALAQAREAFVAAEKQLKEKRKDPEVKIAHETAKTEYETKRAEAVGASVEKMLGERERLVEAEIAGNPRKVGMIEQTWRKAGDVSLIPKSWRESFDSTDFGKTRVGQIFIRSLNMRTAISLSLWGVAVGSGFGSVVGIGSLIARSGVGAAGTYFGSQAFMEGLAQKRRFTVDQKKLQEVESFNLGDTSEAAVKQRDANHDFLGWELARLEAASLLAGKLPGDSPEYERVKQLYFNYVRAEESSMPFESATERLSQLNKWLDGETSRKEKDYREATRARQGLAALLAVAFPVTRIMALTWDEIDVIDGRAVIRPPRVVPAAPVPDMIPSWAQDFAGPDTSDARFVRASPEAAAAAQGGTRVPTAAMPEAPRAGVSSPVAPERVPDATLGGGVKSSPDATTRLQELMGGKTRTVEALVAAEQALGPTMAIEQGGNVWRSAMRLVETGQVSRPQFEKAWANSYVEIAGQEKVPISKVGLVHAGDIVRFNREAGVFEVVPKSNIPIGSDKDLFAVYERLDKEAPEWLKKSVGAPVKPQEVLNTLTPETLGKISPTEIDELARMNESEIDMAARAETKGLGLDDEAKIAAGHGGEAVAGAEKLPPSPEALAKIQKSLEHFANSNLADQEGMMDALARRAEGDPMAQALLERLQESPAYIENRQAFVRLINRLIDFDVYAKIRGMSLREVIGEGVKADAIQEARAGSSAISLNPTARAMRRLAKLIQEVNPDEAARGMSVDTFLKIAPKRLLELIPDLKF